MGLEPYLAALVLAAIGGSPASSDEAPAPWQPGGARGARLRLPLARPARPATLPEDHFGVRFSGGMSRSGGALVGRVLAEADYGFTDRLQLGISLLRLTLVEAGVDGGGLEAPVVRGRARSVFGPFELGGEAALGLPLDGFRRADVGLFGWAHIGEVARVEFAARFGGRFDSDDARWPAAAPLWIEGAIGDRVSIGAGARLESENLGALDLALRPLGRVTLTLGDRSSPPLWTLVASVEGPALELREAEGRAPFLARLDVVLFFDDPDDGVGPGPAPF